jgi:hypothetical protein
LVAWAAAGVWAADAEVEQASASRKAVVEAAPSAAWVECQEAVANEDSNISKAASHSDPHHFLGLFETARFRLV